LAAQPIKGFLLTRNWRDGRDGVELEYWWATDQGPLRAAVHGERAVFFLREGELALAEPILQRERGVELKPVKLKAFDMSPVQGVYFRGYRQARQCADRLRDLGCEPLEADINPAERYLMERFITGSAELVGEIDSRGQYLVMSQPAMRSASYRPPLKVVSFDIETALQGVQLYSIGLHAVAPDGTEERRVFMLGEGATQDYVVSCQTQAEVLQAFLVWLRDYDPDVLIGWNVVNFDAWYLQRVADQLGIELALGREQRSSGILPLREFFPGECFPATAR
jgi:DNA polymerase-2